MVSCSTAIKLTHGLISLRPSPLTPPVQGQDGFFGPAYTAAPKVEREVLNPLRLSDGFQTPIYRRATVFAVAGVTRAGVMSASWAALAACSMPVAVGLCLAGALMVATCGHKARPLCGEAGAALVYQGLAAGACFALPSMALGALSVPIAAIGGVSAALTLSIALASAAWVRSQSPCLEERKNAVSSGLSSWASSMIFVGLMAAACTLGGALPWTVASRCFAIGVVLGAANGWLQAVSYLAEPWRYAQRFERGLDRVAWATWPQASSGSRHAVPAWWGNALRQATGPLTPPRTDADWARLAQVHLLVGIAWPAGWATCGL